jgi:YD repeat-containing protein
VSINLSSTTNTNYSLPEMLAPNGNNNLATSVSYTSSFAVNSIVQPNGATTTTNYDGAGRPLNTTIADGATTNYTYSFNPNNQTATLQDPSGTTRFKRTTYDGFGRPIRVETGYNGTTVSMVDTQYAPCACSPLGKMSKVSQPYAPGGTVYWTTYTYDGSGRTLSITAPDGSKTSYQYQGNNTTITDPAGKWKQQTVDGFGNLITVTEPNNFVTSYAYTLLNQLTTVTMTRPEGTQTRTFQWSGKDMVRATNPENGTVNYTYNAAHQVLTRTDAKNQQTQYTYDSYNRLTDIAHFPVAPQWNGDPNHPEDPLQHVHYTYDTNSLDTSFSAQNTWGRLTGVQFSSWGIGSLAYEYSYNKAGRVITQRLQVPQPAAPAPHVANFDATYQWDANGRMTSLAYPLGGLTYGYSYDSMGHLSMMTENGNQMATAGYNWADQMSSMTYDSFGESRTYDPRMMQLTRIQTNLDTYWGPSPVMDMTYNYTAGQNNGRITSSTDGILGETVNYTYDSYNRLATAQATNNSWGNAYTYDGFGNLTAESVTAGSAPHFSNATNAATNGYIGVTYDANGNSPVLAANGASRTPKGHSSA